MDKENEIIECEYCHTLITENDTICPKCGANCSNVIKKYKKEQQKKEQEKKEEAENFKKNVFKHVQKGQNFVQLFVFMIFVVAGFFMIISFMKFSSFDGLPIDESNENINNKVEDKEEKPKIVKVSYKETAETNKMKVTLDSYDLYEYHSDSFENYNTPNGYQKIAFHFEIYNKLDTTISTGMLIDLLADDSNVENADLELHKGFAELVKGKEKYEKIESLHIKPNSTLKGYIGYLVPKDKKTLKFTIGDYIIIEMDNPVYKG